MDEILEPGMDDERAGELELAEPVDAELVPLEESDEETIGQEPAKRQVPAYKGTGMRWSYLFGAVLTVAIIILAGQNTESVEFEFITWNITAPLAAVILATAFIAVVIDELIGVIWRFRRRRQLREKAELEQLRAQTGQTKRRFGRKP